MAINETVITGKKFRIWDDFASTWKRFSWWTKASDVEMNDGSTVESTVTELATDVGTISSNVDTVIDNVTWYANCSTSDSAQEKVASTIDAKLGDLTTGQKVQVKFTNSNSHSAPTLNVDNKGAKSIKAYGTTAPTVWWQAGDVISFTYDGTNWIMGATEGQISFLNSSIAGKAPSTVVSKTANGLCPQLPNEISTSKYLRQDGSWSTPPNTTTGTSYNAGSCPDNTTFATNGSVARAYSALNSNLSNKGNIKNYKTFTAVNQSELLSSFDGCKTFGVAIFGNNHELLVADEISIDLAKELGRITITLYTSDTYNMQLVLQLSSTNITFRAFNINGWTFESVSVFGIY